jgi:GTP-binding protein Era
MSTIEHRTGHVAIIGRPNVGKSTLLNRLVGHKISITSRRPQTTRHRITGILTRADVQIGFVDTPGFQTEHRTALTRIMNKTVVQALQGVDLVMWVVEALRLDARDEALRKMLPAGIPVILVVNKADRIGDKRELLPFMKRISESTDIAAIVPVSAKTGLQLDDLVDAAARLLPEGPSMYDEDEMTTMSERFLAAELVREKLFRLLGEELPYAMAVEVEGFETTETLRRIDVRIVVDKDSQKAIVIGKGGEKLKAIGTQARHDMEKLFGSKVFLQMFVTVKSGWADDRAQLKRLGYDA